jgi:hypothetical protein
MLRVIEAAAELTCGTPKDIAWYVRGHEPTLTDIQSIRNTILHIEAYFSPHTFFVSKEFYSRTRLYGLADYGAKYAREIMGIDTARAFEIRDVEHEHLVTLFHIHLRQFAAKKKFLFAWRQDLVDHKKPINPDAIATLGSDAGKFIFCIEPERQTFNSNYLKKAKKYFEVFGKPEAKQLFSAEKFRAIFVVLTDRKRKYVLEQFAKEYPYKMFWITTVDLFQKDMGAKIFLTPKDHQTETYALLDVLK